MSLFEASLPRDPMNRRAVFLLPVAMASLLTLPVRAAEAPATARPAALSQPDAEATGKKPLEKETEDPGKARRATLADKIAPVSGNLFTKTRRFEISPGVGLSLDDAFFQKYAIGLKLTYHLIETLSVGVHSSWSFAQASGPSVCKAGTCTASTSDDLKDVPGRVSLLVGAELAWSPIYGKVNVIAEKVLHFDVSLIAGLGAVRYQAPNAEDTMAFAFHFGLGERFFITPSMTLRLELRDYIYSAKTTLSTSSSKTENQLMLELGLSFFVGGSKD